MKPWEVPSALPAAGLSETGSEQRQNQLPTQMQYGRHWILSGHTQSPPYVASPFGYCFSKYYDPTMQQQSHLTSGLKPASRRNRSLSRNLHPANEISSQHCYTPVHQQPHVYMGPGCNQAPMSSPLVLGPSNGLKHQFPCSSAGPMSVPMHCSPRLCWPNAYIPIHQPSFNTDAQRFQLHRGVQNSSFRSHSHAANPLQRPCKALGTSHPSSEREARSDEHFLRLSNDRVQCNHLESRGSSKINIENSSANGYKDSQGLCSGNIGSSIIQPTVRKDMSAEIRLSHMNDIPECVQTTGKEFHELPIQPPRAMIDTTFSMSYNIQETPKQMSTIAHIPLSSLKSTEAEKQHVSSAQLSVLVGGSETLEGDPRSVGRSSLKNDALASKGSKEPKSGQHRSQSHCPGRRNHTLSRSASANLLSLEKAPSESCIDTDNVPIPQHRTQCLENSTCSTHVKRMVSDSCRSLSTSSTQCPANRQMHDYAKHDWLHASKDRGTLSLEWAADNSTSCGVDDDGVQEASRSVSSGESTARQDVKDAAYSEKLVFPQDYGTSRKPCTVEAEPYIKVLVPGYIQWKNRQLQAGVHLKESPEGLTYDEAVPCIWADDCIITTSKEVMGSELVVNTKQCRYERPLINTCVERLGWIRDDQTSNKGNIIWLGGSVPDHDHLLFMRNVQIVNRFPGMWDMTKKRMLAKVLDLYRMLYPDVFDFSPPCWSFPEDCEQIEKILHSKNQDTYIIKPDGGAMGSGVQLVSRFRDIDTVILRGDGNYIMQKYIDNPRLLNKRKFDLRIYAALYSVGVRPKVFISKLGMARFCTEEYRAPTRRNLDNAFMHLTNYSINKDNSSSFLRSSNIHDTSNSKRLLKDVFEELKAEGVDVQSVWKQIKEITAKTFVCLQPWLNLRYRQVYRGIRTSDPSRCFQFLGLDILLDAGGKCWLLEVNSNPSLRIDYFDSQYEGIDIQLESTMDRAIKEPAVSEALAIASRLLLRPEMRKRQSRATAQKPVVSTCNSIRSNTNGGKSIESSTGVYKHASGTVVGKGKAKSRHLAKKEVHSISQQSTHDPGNASATNHRNSCSNSNALKRRPCSNADGAFIYPEPNHNRSNGTTEFSLASKQLSRRAHSVPARVGNVPMPRIKRSASACSSFFRTGNSQRGVRTRDSVPLTLGNFTSLTSLSDYPPKADTASYFSSCSTFNSGADLKMPVLKQNNQGDESDSEGEGRGCASVDAEIMISAYKEMQKCMECLNVLGLRFQVNQATGSKDVATRHAAATPSCGDSHQDELQRSRSRKALNRARPTGPYRPFLKKDRISSKKGNCVLKSSYTKLHKDILKPMHGEQLRPQGCWTSLDPLISSLTAETALVRRLQLLFERLVDFPNKFGLERSRWIEICEIVKIGDILRKVSVPALQPSRGARVPPALGHYSFRPPHRPVPLQRKAYSSGMFCRSASATALQCETDSNDPGSTVAVPGVLCGVRKRRLAIADMETLWLHEVQHMRRQLQLSDSVRGLGLLEVASMMTYLAVLCYPYLPQKATLVSMFLSESGSNKGAVLEQVVRQLEREEELGLSTKASVKTPPPGLSTPCEQDEVHHNCAQSTAAPRYRESSRLSPIKSACGKEKPSRHLVGNSAYETSGTDEIIQRQQHPSKSNFGCSDSNVPLLEARPATEAEENVVNLKRLIGEDLDHLSVLDANCTKLRDHIEETKAQLQEQLEKRVFLMRRKDGASLHPLKIASMQQVFGSQDSYASIPPEEVSKDVERKISACKRSLQSANCELEQTLRVRDETSQRLEQHESQLQYCMRRQQLQGECCREKVPGKRFPAGSEIKAKKSFACDVGGTKRSETQPAPRVVITKGSKDGSAKQLPSIPSERRNPCKAVPTVDKMPEWHEMVCSAWPDLNSAVLELVPRSDKYEAFKRLIDFFELRLDLFYSNVLRNSRDVKPSNRH